MPDKLTDKEIVKALKKILELMLCEGDLQRSATIRNTLDLINRQDEEINRLQARVDDLERNDLPRCKDALRRANEIGMELQAENEELVGNIDRLKEENGNLTVEFQAMRNAANGFKNELFDKTELLKTATAEIEKLEETIEYKDICIEACEGIKTEAYKEFAETAIDRVEKAKAKYQRLCKEQGEEMEEHMHIHFNGIIGIINKLLKELVGENDAR